MHVGDLLIVLPVLYVVVVLRAALPLVLPARHRRARARGDLRRCSAGRASRAACARSCGPRPDREYVAGRRGARRVAVARS